MAIRKLNERERKDWIVYIKHQDKYVSKFNKKQLLRFFEESLCAVEFAELACLIAERRLRKLNDCGAIFPMPTRKAEEAMHLAFPSYKHTRY